MAPRWIVAMLARVVAEERQDEVVGDLEELHGRRVARWGRAAADVVTAAEGLALVASHSALAIARGLSGGGRWVSLMEIRLALRLIRRQPIMTLTSVVALGVGIGMAAGGFSVLRQGLYGELPFENGDRWMRIETFSERTARRAPLDLERLRLFRTSAPALEYIAGVESADFNVVHVNGEIERVAGASVTPGTFAYLPYTPVLGRLLVVGDGGPGAERVALIRESLWHRRFSGSPDILERTLDIAGQDYLVVGVLPDEAEYPSEGEVWLPMDEVTFGATSDRGAVGSRQIGILAPGATAEQADQQLRRLSEQVAGDGRGVEAQRHVVSPMGRALAGPQVQMMMFVVMTMLISVLVIIAANVGNLIVARTSRRSAEIAVRTALGASRSRIVGQLFVEVLAIGVIAAGLGLIAAGGVLALYDRILDELPFWVHLGLDPATVAVVVLLTLLASGVMGIVPALRATRRNTGDALRAAGRGGTLAIGRVGGAMIMLEVALSVALLGGAVVFARGYDAYLNPAFHLPDDRVLTARLVMDVTEADLYPGGAISVEDSVTIAAREIQAALTLLPGVSAVGIASHLPRMSPFPEPLEVEGTGEVTTVPTVAQGPGLFAVLDVEPLVGRGIEETDLTTNALPVVVVNQAFAVEHFGNTQVLGRRLRLVPESDGQGPAPWSEIVGVVPNVMEVTGAGGAAGVYFPFSARRFFSVALRVDSDPLALTGQVRQALFDLDPNLNISEVVRLDDVGAENRTAFAVMSSGMSAISLITMLLSLAGVYSIVSLAVTQRTREIGVRVALGAEAGSILRSVLQRSGSLVLGGATIGALVGWQASSVRLFVFAVPEPGPLLFPGLVGIMALAGLLACWIPARRALAIQPVEALRYDT